MAAPNLPVPPLPATQVSAQADQVPTTASPDPSVAATPDPLSGIQSNIAPPQAPFAGGDQVVSGPPAAAATTAHHAALGRLAKFVMGSTTSYEPQADGSVKPVESPTKPGDLFRGLLLSAVLGAGTKAHGFGEGFATGLSDAGQRAVANQDKQRAQAIQDQQQRREQEKLNLEKQKADEEKAFHQAEIEKDKVTTLHLAYALNHAPKEKMDATNAASDLAYRESMQAGGHEPQIIINGQNINGQANNLKTWEDAIQKNPDLAHSPDKNHVRTAIMHLNVPDGATIKDGEWVDKDGKQIDMHPYATMRVVDVPVDSLKQERSFSGAEMNGILGSKQFDPAKSYTTSLSSLYTLKGSLQKDALDSARSQAEIAAANRQAQAANRAADQLEKSGRTQYVTSMNDAIKSAEEELRQEQAGVNPDDQRIAQLKVQISDLRNQLVGAAAAVQPEIKFNKVQKQQIAVLPKPSKAGDTMPIKTMQQYLAMFPNDPTGNMAHQAALENGWVNFETPAAPTTKPPAAGATTPAAPALGDPSLGYK